MDNSKSLIDKIENGVVNVAKGVGKCVNYVANDLGQDTKKLAVYGIAGAVVLGAGAGVARSEPTRIMRFSELAGTPSGKILRMPLGTNLKLLDTVIPALNVSIGSHWHMGFINYGGGGANVVGWAENIYRNTTGREGLMDGMYRDTIVVGNRPDDFWTVEDVGQDGIADYYESTGTLVFDADDNFYYSGDVMLGTNKVYGDVNELPIYPSSGTTVYLPEMEVDSRPIRTGPAGMYELLDLSENWLSQDCHPYDNNDCEGADWNYDGQVNFEDFTHVARDWDPNHVAE